jgi:propanol-preferring alcohol dehydrogenase
MSPLESAPRGIGAEKRRSQRILLRVPIDLAATDRAGKAFEEQTHTMIVNAHGALVQLRADIKETSSIRLRNRFTKEEMGCRLVWLKVLEDGTRHVAIEFLKPSPRFWQVDFPPEDWDVINMKAAVLKEYGQPMQVIESAKPVPAADEVLLRVEACGVCHSDLHMAHGDWPDVKARMTLPAILGHEVVGHVTDCGADVKQLARGQRVGVGWLHSTCGACEMCAEGAENLCLNRTVTGIAAPGGFAEYMRIKASHAIPIPDGLASDKAAPFFCAGLTVYHACRSAAIEAGQHVAVFGIGGLGHLAVQLAAQAGAEVTAVDIADEKLALARKCGAHHLVRADAKDALKQIRVPGAVNVAIVTATAKSAYDQAFRVLRRRGTIVVVGLPKEDLTFFADDLVVTEARIVGSAVGTRAEMREVLALAAAGKLACATENFKLDEINDVFARMERGQLLGRAVIKL